jgi:hypothetical protein
MSSIDLENHCVVVQKTSAGASALVIAEIATGKTIFKTGIIDGGKVRSKWLTLHPLSNDLLIVSFVRRAITYGQVWKVVENKMGLVSGMRPKFRLVRQSQFSTPNENGIVGNLSRDSPKDTDGDEVAAGNVSQHRILMRTYNVIKFRCKYSIVNPFSGEVEAEWSAIGNLDYRSQIFAGHVVAHSKNKSILYATEPGREGKLISVKITINYQDKLYQTLRWILTDLGINIDEHLHQDLPHHGIFYYFADRGMFFFHRYEVIELYRREGSKISFVKKWQLDASQSHLVITQLIGDRILLQSSDLTSPDYNAIYYFDYTHGGTENKSAYGDEVEYLGLEKFAVENRQIFFPTMKNKQLAELYMPLLMDSCALDGYEALCRLTIEYLGTPTSVKTRFY